MWTLVVLSAVKKQSSFYLLLQSQKLSCLHPVIAVIHYYSVFTHQQDQYRTVVIQANRVL